MRVSVLLSLIGTCDFLQKKEDISFLPEETNNMSGTGKPTNDSRR
jgi:hypothetical protein